MATTQLAPDFGVPHVEQRGELATVTLTTVDMLLIGKSLTMHSCNAEIPRGARETYRRVGKQMIAAATAAINARRS